MALKSDLTIEVKCKDIAYNGTYTCKATENGRNACYNPDGIVEDQTTL